MGKSGTLQPRNAVMLHNPEVHRIAEAHGVRLVRHTGGRESR